MYELIVKLVCGEMNICRCIKKSIAVQVFSVFSVFFASYNFVSHPKNSVSLQSKTSETNLFFSLFRLAHFRFRFASFRFHAK